MKPTSWPAARRIALRHAPVEPLPLVPAMSAPFSFRSGPPMWSSRARVRSVPSFIAKRPCREMKSSASWYVNDSRAPADLCLQGVLDEHRPRHRADPTRIRGQPSRDLFHPGPEIADLAPIDPVRADVHDGSAR